ncbi:unnamed protein product, partial [Allacma fusca]
IIQQFQEKLQDLQLSEEQNSNMNLLRFLRARDFKLNLAEDMLRKNLAWRKENDMDNIRNYQVPSHFQQDLPYDVVGFDSGNSPVFILP